MNGTQKRICFAFALALIVVAGPAWAEWRIEVAKGSSARRPGKIAALDAGADDRGIRATLTIGCQSAKAETRLISTLELSTQLMSGWGGRLISVRYRIDEDVRRDHAALLNENFSRRFHLRRLEPADLRTARRLEVTIFPVGASKLSFAFDLAGADKAMASIPCKAAVRPSRRYRIGASTARAQAPRRSNPVCLCRNLRTGLLRDRRAKRRRSYDGNGSQ